MEPGIKTRGKVTRKFISGDIGASPWRVSRSDRLPRFGSGSGASPTGGKVNVGKINGHGKREKSDGTTTYGGETRSTKPGRNARRNARKRAAALS